MKANNNDIPMVLQIIQEADIAKLIDFVNNGGDVFVQDADGNDAMYYASKSGNEEIVAMLEMLAEGMGKSFSTSLKSTESKTRSAKRSEQDDAGECTATVDEIWALKIFYATTRKEIEEYVLALKKLDFRFNDNLATISYSFYAMEEEIALELVNVIWENCDFDVIEFLHWQLIDYSVVNYDKERYKLRKLINFFIGKNIRVIIKCARCTSGDGSLAHRIISYFPEEEALEIFKELKEEDRPLLKGCDYQNGYLFPITRYSYNLLRPAQTFLEHAIDRRKPKIVRFYLSNCNIDKEFISNVTTVSRECEYLNLQIKSEDSKRRNSILWPINKLWDSGYISQELLEIYAYFVEAKRQVMEYGEVKFPEKLVFNKYREYKWDEWI